MTTNQNVMTWSGLYAIAFIVLLSVVKPDEFEKVAIVQILLATLIYLSVSFFTILSVINVPFIKKMLEGTDKRYTAGERKQALILISAIFISVAIFLGQVIPELLTAAYN